MKSLYQTIDDTLMSGANATVKAWNWTTGRTKADLASLLSGLSSIFLFPLLALHPKDKETLYSLVSTIGLFSVFSLANAKCYQKNANEEASVVNHGLKSMEAELLKSTYELHGATSLTTTSLIWVSDAPIQIKDSFGLFMASIGASNYLMRVDYIPPRKDCIRRGLDKLTEVWDNARAPKPVYSANPSN